MRNDWYCVARFSNKCCISLISCFCFCSHMPSSCVCVSLPLSFQLSSSLCGLSSSRSAWWTGEHTAQVSLGNSVFPLIQVLSICVTIYMKFCYQNLNILWFCWSVLYMWHLLWFLYLNWGFVILGYRSEIWLDFEIDSTQLDICVFTRREYCLKCNKKC